MKKIFLSIMLTAGLCATAQVQKIENLRITGGNPGVGKVLKSDAVGNATWEDGSLSIDAASNTSVANVRSLTGRVWMNRNLGASRVATAVDDFLAYGSLYQWGRGNDGHQLINYTAAGVGTAVNGTTATLSATDIPGDNLFITIGAAPFDWRATQNDNLWQGKYGINNPCPIDYRLPTNAELTAEVTAYNIANSADAFASSLKFTVPGYRINSVGSLSSVGSNGAYWSSTVSGSSASYRGFNGGGTDTNADSRAYGFSVRCLKD
jgi:uncharacterized protein (TIGR02145 family)